MQADEGAEALEVVDEGSRRLENRYYINSQATQVTLAFTDESGEQRLLKGRLADLSTLGAKILINGKVPVGMEVELKVHVKEIDFQISRMALVRWQQPRDAHTWWTGCKVPAGFDDDVIEGLAAAKVLNRRRDPRYPSKRPVRIRWELSDNDHQAMLVNYSKGGVCLQMATQDFQNRLRLLLVVSSEGAARESIVPARVLWQQKKGDRHTVGCELTSADGFGKIRQFAEPTTVARKRIQRARLRRPMTKWFAIAVVVLALVQTVRVISDQPGMTQWIGKTWQTLVEEPIRRQLIWLSSDSSDESTEATEPSE